jgi:osmotically inducible lipoprotein OsmB
MKKLPVLLLCLVLLAGCDHLSRQQQRALSGGAIGAAGGAVVGVLTGGIVTGALIGAAGGAAVGALTK